LLEKILNIPLVIVDNLAKGGAIPRLWILYFSFGAITFGMLSYPFEDAAFILIPMFLLAGIFGLIGCLVVPRYDPTLKASEKYVNIGMSLMVVASWTRAILIWGLSPKGLGNSLFGSVVWVWITIGALFLLIAVAVKGLR
jgi:hypothetical protein